MEDGEEVSALKIITQWDSRAKVVHIPHGGVSCARNAGIAEARGDYLTFCDADDYLGCGVLKAYADAIEINPKLNIVFTDVIYHSLEGITQRIDVLEKACHDAYIKSLFDGTFPGYSYNKCYSMAFIKNMV